MHFASSCSGAAPRTFDEINDVHNASCIFFWHSRYLRRLALGIAQGKTICQNDLAVDLNTLNAATTSVEFRWKDLTHRTACRDTEDHAHICWTCDFAGIIVLRAATHHHGDCKFPCLGQWESRVGQSWNRVPIIIAAACVQGGRALRWE